MYNNEFRSMKRSHSPDSFDQGPAPYRGGFRSHPEQPFAKRHRNDLYQPQTIFDKIVRIGDVNSRNADIGLLAKDIDADLLSKPGDEENVKAISSKISTCIVAFPTRVATYTTLIGLITVKHFNVACQTVNTLLASYPVYLESQKWNEALTIMHSLASLVNCKVITPSAMIAQFQVLLDTTLVEDIPQARSDYYAYTVMSCLPYVAFELQSEQEAFDKLLNILETYLNRRSKEHLSVIRVWITNDSTCQMDYLDSLWVQIKNFRANTWQEHFLHRPYYDKENKDIMATSLIPQNLPPAQIPPHTSEIIYPSPRVAFELFEDDVTEGHRSMPGFDKIERFCIQNYIRNIISEFADSPRECARHLTRMYKSDQMPMKHILIEVLLGEIFTLPKPRNHELLYYSLLWEFTKIYGSSKNPDEAKFNYDSLLHEAVRRLYENLPNMNITCLTRFVKWLSFHLNNTQFIFPWQSWSDSTSGDCSPQKRIFVQEILLHCKRFSFDTKIDVLVKDNLQSLVPPQASIQYKPLFSDNPNTSQLSNLIKKLIVEKSDAVTFCEMLNIRIEGVKLPDDFELKDEKPFDRLHKIDIFTAIVLTFAAKSLTHISSAIGKFKNVFKALTDIEGGHHQLLKTIHSCIETHPQLHVILVEKLVKAELVDATKVFEWIFSDSMKSEHMKGYPWEILNNSLSVFPQKLKALIKAKEDNRIAEEKKEAEKKSEKEAAVEAATAADEEQEKQEPEKVEGDIEMKQEEGVTNNNNGNDNNATKEVTPVEDFDGKIVKAQEDLHKMIVLVFDLFSKSLTNHIQDCEKSGISYMDDWFRWTTGRMQEVYYNHHAHCSKIFDQIKDIVDKVPGAGGMLVKLN